MNILPPSSSDLCALPVMRGDFDLSSDTKTYFDWNVSRKGRKNKVMLRSIISISDFCSNNTKLLFSWIMSFEWIKFQLINRYRIQCSKWMKCVDISKVPFLLITIKVLSCLYIVIQCRLFVSIEKLKEIYCPLNQH